MRTSAAEKYEIIRLVEEAALPVKRVLSELDIPRSTFYHWFGHYQAAGYDGLEDVRPHSQRYWSIPDNERAQVVQIALEQPERSPRELAAHIVDRKDYFISESSVYRILKHVDLVTSPAFTVICASDKFKHPTKRINELWQTDFTQFKVVGWGWYYLSTVLDDYSRYIVAWKLTTGMTATDVEDTLNLALAATGVIQVQVRHRPRLLSDNGPAYVSEQLAAFLKQYDITHVRGNLFIPRLRAKSSGIIAPLSRCSVWRTITSPGSWSRPSPPSSTITTITATVKPSIT